MNPAPTPAVMPSRRPKAEPLHCLRIRVNGYTYVGPEATPEEVREHRAKIRESLTREAPPALLALALIDGREVDVPVGQIVGIEVGPMPTAVRRALVRDGVLSPLGGSLVAPPPRCVNCGTGHPELSTEQFFELRDRAGAGQ